MATVTIRDANLDECIRRLRAFLTQERIVAASKELTERLTPVNRFRELALLEKQPYLAAFNARDRLTLGGNRRLTVRRSPPSVLQAAEAGALLAIIEPGLPAALRVSMASRLLDLTGKAEAVVMEWRAAAHYRKRGFAIEWTDKNVQGPEFLCRREQLVFGVECKRVTRMAKERLGDRLAYTLEAALLQAFEARGWGGIVEWDASLEALPPEPPDINELIEAMLPRLPVAEWETRNDTLGWLRARIDSLPMTASTTWKQWLDSKQLTKAADQRFAGATLPLDKINPTGALALFLRGPRYTQEEFGRWIRAQALHGAAQLSRAPFGVLLIEAEGVDEARTFSESMFCADVNEEVFATHPSVVAVCWMSAAIDIPGADVAITKREYFAQRNQNVPASIRDAIPLPGAPHN